MTVERSPAWLVRHGAAALIMPDNPPVNALGRAESKRELDESTIVKIADFLENQVREEKKEINDPKPA